MLLPRPHLTEKVLQSAAAHSLTAVIAPMGYGKTTLARAVAEALPGRVHYYAVPGGPHDGHFVWHDMCVAFEGQGLGIAPALRRLGLPETASQARQALDVLRGLAGQGKQGGPDAPLCLILDDCHHVADPAGVFDAFWERAARETIPHLHIMLFSRTKPSVKLEELRLKGYAALFGQDFLAFSQEETKAFFRRSGIHDPVAAAESQKYSEGWPAALQLCKQSWQQNGRIAASAVSGDMDALLTNMVFAAYSPYSSDERDLLLRLCVLEAFTDADVRAMTIAGQGSVNLRILREKNPFLGFDGASGRYQFHSIFRDFLRKELERDTRIDKPSLYRLAGECCFARRDLVAAFRLFLRAGRDEDLSRLLDTFLRFEDDCNVFYFAEERFRAASAVPWRVRLRNPLGWLCVVYTYALMWNDQRTATLLDEAEERFRTAPEIPEYLKHRLQGEIEVIRAALSFNDLDTLLRHYAKAARLLNGPSHFAGEDSVWNYGAPSLSFIALREPGRYRELQKTATAILRLYPLLSGGKGQGVKTLIRAEYLAARGDFSGAEPLCADVLAMSRDSDKHLASALVAAFWLARIFLATGRPEKALPALEALRPRVEALDVIDHYECLDLAVGYVGAALGRYDAIPRWLREGEIFDPPHNAMPYLFGLGLTAHARALLLQGEYRRLALVAAQIPHAASIVSLLARIHGKVLEAVAAWHTRGQSDALALLREALDLSRPDGIILPLAEYGGHILPLLHRAKRGSPQDAHCGAVLALARRIAHGTAHPAAKSKSLLAPREREIMGHVTQGATNPAIADNLHISVNTVKDLLANAYAKLGAAGRVDAAKRFTELYGETRR